MKYIITDKGEVNIGQEQTYHARLAEECKGKVIAAGHYKRNEDGTYEVYGSSIGYSINAKPEDAITLQNWENAQAKLLSDKIEGNTPWS